MKRCFLILTAIVAGGPAQAAAEKPLRVRVVTYNIHHAAGMDDRYDVERIAGVLGALAPDLVALQEVHSRTRTAKGEDQSAQVGSALGLTNFFAKAMDHDGGGYGVAVLSRWPALASANHPLPGLANTEPRAAAAILVEAAPSVRVRFLGTHLDHLRDPGSRALQIARLVGALGVDTNTPAILAGDFNCALEAPEITPLLAGWRAAWTNGTAPTWPADRPRKPIDHVLVRPAHRWRVLECRAVDEQVASDHRPVLAVLELLPE
jgi:endonuclease/exonuclease/phosphatase family metal-dependent hydrolase